METIALKTTMSVSSPSFEDEGPIPDEFTCNGSKKNPALVIKGIPEGTKSLAIIMDDPDAPGRIYDHWLIWNIPPEELIPENFSTGIEGSNSKGDRGYTGPCPPSGTHRYFFKVYAVDSLLNIPKGADKRTLEQALQNHTLAFGEIIGLYSKK